MRLVGSRAAPGTFFSAHKKGAGRVNAPLARRCCHLLLFGLLRRIFRRILRLQLLDGLARFQLLAGQAGMVRSIAHGPEKRPCAWWTESAGAKPRESTRTTSRRSARTEAPHHVGHALELLPLLLFQQLLELAIHFLLQL